MSASEESRPLISDPRNLDPHNLEPQNSEAQSLDNGVLAAEAAPSLPGITLRAQPVARSPRAVLYQGWDWSHRRRVLVKVGRASDDPVAVRRIGREGAVLLRLRHPSIVRLYAFHPSSPAKNDPATLVMEYVPGTTLAALVAAQGRLPPARAIQIIEEVAAALDCVHALGVVHRDIQPSSILLPSRLSLPSGFALPRRGAAKLTDFGVARFGGDLPLTVMGDILGTTEYASPEQVQGVGAADACSDVYSLAAVTYFALTGTPPFRAADASAQSQLSVMHRQVFSDPPPLRLYQSDLPPAIEDAVLRGLAKAPEARFASAGQLASALRAALAASEGDPQQKAREASARRTGILAGAAAGAVLLAGLALWTVGHRSLPVPAPVAAALPKSSVLAVPKQSVAAKPKHLAAAKPKKTASAGTARVPKKAPVKPVLVTATPPAVRTAHLPPPRLQPDSAKTLPLKLPKIAAVPASRLPASANTQASAHVPAAPARAGWYMVSGWIALPGPSSPNQAGQKPPLVRASAAGVQVDGHPLPQLALGQWAILPAGTHRVTFQPAAGMGAGPRTWTIKVAPLVHLSQQVPLPAAPLPDIPTHLRNP